MLTSVYFNNYCLLITYKVHNVIADWFLSPKLESFNLF